MFGTSTENYSNAEIVENQFPSVLLSVKRDVEQQFHDLIEEMKEDPLNGLFVDKLPTPEEIFYEEWANDRFPTLDIPTVGGYIQYVGRKAVGDINLDNNPPNADLNISSFDNPSEITYEQFNSLWNKLQSNSLVSKSSKIWFRTLQVDSPYRGTLKDQFNLTESQITFILNWINVSRNTWLPYLARQDRLTLIPLPFFGLLGAGLALLIYSTPKLRKESKKILESRRSLKNGKQKLDSKQFDKINKVKDE